MASDTSSSAAGSAAEAPATSNQAYSPDELAKGAKAVPAGADLNLDLILEVPVQLSLQVGATQLPIRELVRLVEGSVIALDREASQPMDVLVNGTLIAHGEIVLVDDQFGVRLTDVVSPLERIEKISK
jgi:flagellar motor switch protein FliN/FliY